jgi:hypothetical protein
VSDELAKARATLLRALEQLDAAQGELGAKPDRVDLVVVYSLGFDGPGGWHHISGWVASPGPKWSHLSLLEHAADAHESAMGTIDDDPPEGDKQ